MCQTKVVTAELLPASSLSQGAFLSLTLPGHHMMHAPLDWRGHDAGWVYGRMYYYPYQNNAETLPLEEESSRSHPVHTFDMTQHPNTVSAGRSQSVDEADSAGLHARLPSWQCNPMMKSCCSA